MAGDGGALSTTARPGAGEQPEVPGITNVAALLHVVTHSNAGY